MSDVVTRFAPSPTGHLHLGGARTAIFSWLLARHFNGRFHLRIEDTDLIRSRQEYTDSILASMHWLGLNWDNDIIWQTQRVDLYNSYIDKLLASGNAYWCSCTVEDVEKMRETARQKGLKPRYDGHCRNLGLGPGKDRCVRLKAPQSGKIVFDDMFKGHIAVDASELDDMVLRKADGMPTYNMAVVVDDYEMGVTHVIRGDDHVSNTPKQILIYQALNIPIPVFGHVPMILGPDKQKLSKRHGARAVVEYEKDGFLPDALISYLARLGWSRGNQEIFSRKELIQYFDGKNLNPSSAAFDPVKLDWCNSQFMRNMPIPHLAELVTPFVKDIIGDEKIDTTRLEPLCIMFKERTTNLKNLAESFRPLLVKADQLEYKLNDAKKHFTEKGKEYLIRISEIFKNLEHFDSQNIEQTFNEWVATNNFKFKEVAPPLRTALMGFMGGSHLNEIMDFLGKTETLARIKKAINWQNETQEI